MSSVIDHLNDLNLIIDDKVKFLKKGKNDTAKKSKTPADNTFMIETLESLKNGINEAIAMIKTDFQLDEEENYVEDEYDTENKSKKKYVSELQPSDIESDTESLT